MAQHVSYIIYGLMFVVGFTLALVSSLSSHNKDKALFVSIIERQRSALGVPLADGGEVGSLMSIQSATPLATLGSSSGPTPRDSSSSSARSPDRRSSSRPERLREKVSTPAGALVVTSTHFADVPDNVAATAAATGGLLIMAGRERPLKADYNEGEMKSNEGAISDKSLFSETPTSSAVGIVLGTQVNVTKYEKILTGQTGDDTIANTTNPNATVGHKDNKVVVDDLIPVNVYKSFRALVTLVDGHDFDNDAAQAWLSVVAAAGEVPVRNIRLRYQRAGRRESSNPSTNVTSILTQIGVRTEQEAKEAINRVLNAAQHPSQFDRFFIHVLEA